MYTMVQKARPCQILSIVLKPATKLAFTGVRKAHEYYKMVLNIYAWRNLIRDVTSHCTWSCDMGKIKTQSKTWRIIRDGGRSNFYMNFNLLVDFIEFQGNWCKKGSLTSVRLKFHLARLDSTRLDSTRSTLSSQSSQSSKSRRACRARRAVLFQHGGRRTILYKFSRFYALAYTNPICFIK